MEQDKKQPKKGLIFVALALALVIAGFACWNSLFQKEYIDGNVLNLPYINAWNEDDLLDSPWKNSQFFHSLMFRSLFLADSSLTSVQPDLAETYAIYNDGLTYEITLKEGQFWSDSQLIDTGDVVFSIKTILRAKDVNGIYTAAFSNIQGAAAYISGETDDLEGLSTNGNIITIQLEEQSPTLIQVLAQFVILPEHCFENSDLANILKDNYWKIPVVSGMYQVQNVDIDKTVTLGRNPYYGDTPPQIDQVVLHVDYKFTTLDYYSTNNITEIINYRSIRYMEEYKIDILFYRYLMFNIKGIDGNYNEAMDDPYVRQAIAYAIDRETLLSDIYLDSGTLIDSGVARSNQAYDGVTIDYNVEKAKELLAMSDYDLDRPLRLTYYYLDATSQTFMEKVAEDLEEVGFTVDLFRCETTTLYDGREYDLALKGLSAFNLNEWYIEYTSSSPQLNKLFGGVNEFEVPVKQLILQLEGDERDAILLELQALEHETMYKIPLFTLGQVLYINDERVNLPTNCTFGNTWYKYDVDFEYWSIKTE